MNSNKRSSSNTCIRHYFNLIYVKITTLLYSKFHLPRCQFLISNFACIFSDTVLLVQHFSSSRWLTNEKTFTADANRHLQMQTVILEKVFKNRFGFLLCITTCVTCRSFFAVIGVSCGWPRILSWGCVDTMRLFQEIITDTAFS